MSASKRVSGGVELSIGQLRRQIVLESEAVYRVCELGPASVQVEVVRSPGLTAGQRFAFTRAAVLNMEVVDGSGGEP